MSANTNNSNNYSDLLQEFQDDVKYKENHLTKEEMNILTEKLSEFNNSGGDPCCDINCAFESYNVTSSLEKDDEGIFKLKTHAYMHGSGQKTITISINNSKGEKYGSTFGFTINGKDIFGVTLCMDMVELQMLKCCIDSLIDATLPLYKEETDRKRFLFLPEKEEAIEAKRKSFIEFFKGIGLQVKKDDVGTSVIDSGGNVIMSTNIL